MKKPTDRSASPFAVLKTLEVRQAPRTKIDRLREQARKGPEPSGDIDFGQAMAGARRLPQSHQADLGRPRPAPVPRPKEREEKIEAVPARPRGPLSDEAAYRAAMQDVVTLAPSGRIDPTLLHAPRQAQVRTPESGGITSARGPPLF